LPRIWICAESTLCAWWWHSMDWHIFQLETCCEQR
jgi:hypothetical protein